MEQSIALVLTHMSCTLEGHTSLAGDITGCAAAAEPPVVVIGAASMYCGAAV